MGARRTKESADRMSARSITDPPKALRGVVTALVTPFRNGEVDWPRLDALVDRQIDAGIDWVAPLGTTGESPTLADKEHERVAQRVIERAAGRCGVMVGAGSNCTAKTIATARRAAGLGADAVLLVTPYYNRPTQEGMFAHFSAVASAVDVPIMLYNVPMRTGVTLSNDTVVRLREKHANIAAIKDATGNVDGLTDLVSRCDITVLSGDDTLTWPMMALGAVGVVSVISNLVPALMKSLVAAAASGDLPVALGVHRRVYDLAAGIGKFGPNPVPIKTAMAMAGLIEEEFRLPLCAMDAADREGIERVLRRHEIGVGN